MSTSSLPKPNPPPAQPGDDTLLNVKQLAELWDVSHNCIYQWRDAGRLPCLRQGAHDQWMTTAAEARAAKVLRQSELMRRLTSKGVRSVSFDVARHTAGVQPEPWPPKNEPRYSVDDVETIVRIDAERQAQQEVQLSAEPPAPVEADNAPMATGGGTPETTGAGPDAQGSEAPPIEASDHSAVRTLPDAPEGSRRDRHRAILDYLELSQRPCDLPSWFWAGPSCPRFIPPTGVFRFEYSIARFDTDTKRFETSVRRSAGHKLVDGTVKFIPADVAWRMVSGLRRVGRCPRGLERANLEYDAAEQEWLAEYRRHGGPLAQLDFGVGDREAAILRYVADEKSPADLPAWFWDTETMPAFVPPFETFLIECGEQSVEADTGEPMTWLTRSEGWEETWLADDDAPRLQPRPRIEQMFPIDGAHAKGTVPEQFVASNWRYLIAKEAWEAQWHRHRRLREAAVAMITTSNGSG